MTIGTEGYWSVQRKGMKLERARLAVKQIDVLAKDVCSR
jgi:hypothetical protein